MNKVDPSDLTRGQALVLGFMFGDDRVLMTWKSRPAVLTGLLNGIGGKRTHRKEKHERPIFAAEPAGGR